MSSRTRYFLIGSGLVVAVGLAAGVVAYYSGAVGRGGTRAELAYVPAEARAVGYANVRDIMDSQFRQRLRADLPVGEGRDQLMEATGIDAEKDIDSVVAAILGGPENGGAVVMLRGRFDRARVEKLATEHGATAEEYKGVRILLGSGGASGMTGIAFLEPTVLGLGFASSLKAAIDAHAAGNGVVNDEALMRAVSEIETSGNAWLVGRTAALSTEAELPDQVKRHLAGLEWVALSADVNDTVRARVRAEAKDDQSAEDLRSVVNGAIAAARMFAERDVRLATALKSIETTGRGRSIELVFTAPADLIDLMHMGPRPAPGADAAPPPPPPPPAPR